jgi:acetylornithine deacetylase/succinyl-diaminopimelate desuccinylase-like protein
LWAQLVYPADVPDEALRDTLTADTVELLQQLVRNACVNDGTESSGGESRNADVLQSLVEVTGVDIERWEPVPGRASFVARLPGRDPTAPSLCLMGHTDVVPVDPSGWDRDPFGGELVGSSEGVTELWGRGAVDMLNLTASMAVAFRDVARRGVRPLGDLVFFAVADEEAGSAHGARWVAEHHREAIAVDNVLSENGGLHDGPEGARVVSVTVAEKGVAWRRLRVRGTPGHGSMPFRSDNALVKAAAVVQRLADYRPAPRFHELWRDRVHRMALPDEMRAALVDEDAIEDLLAELPNRAAAAHLHACTHTTFSPNLVDGGVMKANVIPSYVDLEVDVRTMPGETADDVAAHLRAALGDLADEVEVTALMNDPASVSRTDTALWDSMQRAVAAPFPDAELHPSFAVGFTDLRVFRELGAVAYGAGLMSRELDAAEFGRRFHGHNERIDVESISLTTHFFRRVVEDFGDLPRT